MRERIRQLREMLDMTQREFGDMLGVGRHIIANIETGRSSVKAILADHICHVFHVDRAWLYNGEGEAFLDNDDAALRRLSVKYGLDEKDRRLILAYARLPAEEREDVAKMLLGLAHMSVEL